MKLQSVTHYLDSNTIEAAWIEEKFNADGELIALERVKCQAYSSEQRAEFVADTGAPQYADLANWP